MGYLYKKDLKKLIGVKFVKFWISGVKKLMFCYFFLLTDFCFLNVINSYGNKH